MVRARKSDEVKAVLFCNNGDYFCSGIDYEDIIECTDEKSYKALVKELVSTLRSVEFLSIYYIYISFSFS